MAALAEAEAEWERLQNSSPLRRRAVAMGTGGLVAPIKLTEVLPEYTTRAEKEGIQGDVYIEAIVMVDGTVTEAKLIRGFPDDELNQRALEAVAKWTFTPGYKDGLPVPVIALFTITYRIH